jgi:hypothetical protein
METLLHRGDEGVVVAIGDPLARTPGRDRVAQLAGVLARRFGGWAVRRFDSAVRRCGGATWSFGSSAVRRFDRWAS